MNTLKTTLDTTYKTEMIKMEALKKMVNTQNRILLLQQKKINQYENKDYIINEIFNIRDNQLLSELNQQLKYYYNIYLNPTSINDINDITKSFNKIDNEVENEIQNQMN